MSWAGIDVLCDDHTCAVWRPYMRCEETIHVFGGYHTHKPQPQEGEEGSLVGVHVLCVDIVTAYGIT